MDAARAPPEFAKHLNIELRCQIRRFGNARSSGCDFTKESGIGVSNRFARKNSLIAGPRAETETSRKLRVRKEEIHGVGECIRSCRRDDNAAFVMRIHKRGPSADFT